MSNQVVRAYWSRRGIREWAAGVLVFRGSRRTYARTSSSEELYAIDGLRLCLLLRFEHLSIFLLRFLLLMLYHIISRGCVDLASRLGGFATGVLAAT